MIYYSLLAGFYSGLGPIITGSEAVFYNNNALEPHKSETCPVRDEEIRQGA